MTEAPIDRVLGAATKVRKRQPGQWSACCTGPNHANGDRTPSLSIRETPEGAVLLHCFAGCEAAEIVAAMGLELHDLFPPLEQAPGAPKRTPRLLTAGQALELLADESNLVAVAAGNVGNGITLTPDDTTRVMLAAGRINYLREQAKGL